jgi:hypothetical protein
MEPGYIMGDPKYADSVCQPTGACHGFDGTNDFTVTDPAELAQLGLSIVSWEYPEPIENTFSFGGISLSSEAAASLFQLINRIPFLFRMGATVRLNRLTLFTGVFRKFA